MISTLRLWSVFALFALAAAAILVCGVRMTGLADCIADRTRLGEAVVGGVLLGAATSLSSSIVSLTAALAGRAGRSCAQLRALAPAPMSATIGRWSDALRASGVAWARMLSGHGMAQARMRSSARIGRTEG